MIAAIRLAALRAAAAVLCDRVRPVVARLDNTEATWCWPGTVRVYGRDTGGLIAQSEPGRPCALHAHGQWQGAPLNDADRLKELAAFGRLLAARDRMTQVFVTLPLQHDAFWPVKACAVWRWPGVLRVTVRDTGRLIAQSLPGRPVEMDAEAIASEATA